MFSTRSFALCAWISSCLAAIGEAQVAPALFAAESFQASSGCAAVAVADMDGDARLDVVASTVVGGIDVLLGDGGGHLKLHGTVHSGPGSAYLAVEDWNGDGAPDVAIANLETGTVSTFLNDGAGLLVPAASTVAGVSLVDIVSADFDGDGELDLAVADGDLDQVQILIGDGTGRFEPTQRFSVGSMPVDLVAADWNHDGRADIASANHFSADVTVLASDGAGGFDAQWVRFAGAGPRALATADVDGDGELDLVIAGGGPTTLALGDGAAGFTIAATFDAGHSPVAIALGDVDGNGAIDLATTNINFSNNVALSRGDGSGGFEPYVEHYGVSAPGSIALADLNGDGALDAVVGNLTLRRVTVLLSASSGEWLAPRPTQQSGTRGALGDLDGDGRDDLVSIQYSRAEIARGDGHGTFGPARHVPGNAYVAKCVDRESDGDLDLFLLDLVSVHTALNDGKGNFEAGPRHAFTGSPREFVAGRWNADRFADLAVILATGEIELMLGDESSGFEITDSISVSADPAVLATGDFDGDGHADLAFAQNDVAELRLARGDGRGGFDEWPPLALDHPATSVAAEDLDHDGRAELALTSGSHVILAGFDPARGFEVTLRRLDRGDPHTAVLADFDGDGELDLAVSESPWRSLGVYLGDGHGELRAPRLFGLSGWPEALIVGDFEGDGAPDLVSLAYGAPTVSLPNLRAGSRSAR